MSDLLIDRAAPADLPAIAELAAVIWRAHYPGIISQTQIDYMLARMYDVAVMRGEMNDGVVYLRATMDGEWVGFAACGPAGAGESKLHKLYVHPHFQRRGIGAALLVRAEQEAVSRGSNTLILNVNKRNEPAIAAYRKHGFSVREAVTLDIGQGFVMDDYVMAKPLPPNRTDTIY